jgi:ABC-type multidrug transport system fused ATPase/permease subunit
MAALASSVGINSPTTTAPSSKEESLRAGVREAGFFLRYLRPDWRLVVGVIALTFTVNLLRLPLLYLPTILTAHFQPAQESAGSDMTARLGQGILDILRSGFGSPGYLVAAVVIAFVGILLLGPLQLIRSYWSGRVGANLLYQLRLDVFKNLKRLNILAVYERGAGPFVQRLTRDLLMLHDLVTGTLSGLIGLFLQVAIFLTALLLLEPGLTLVVLIGYAALQPVLLLFNRRIQSQAGKMQELHEGVTTQLVESIGGYRDIIAAGYFHRLTEQFRDRAEGLRRESIRALLWSQACELLLTAAFALLAAVPYFVVLGRLDRIEQVGRMITYVGLLSSLLPALAGLWGSTIELALATPSMRAVHELLTAPDPAPLTAATRPPPSLPQQVHSIRFDGVGLQMAGRWIVRDLSFELRGGRMTALIGESGAGKTTIFYLLLRLVRPTCGTIWINDIPLADFAEADLRSLVGFIPQNPFIFNASLRDNLLVAAALPGQTDALLADVTTAAQLQELVRSRHAEGGLDAGAGYLGMRLSAGERQRVALGRLLVQDPQIIVADEYTANIDVKTAQVIQEMLRTRFADRTRLVITHELCNARGADTILVLEGGRIVQSGTHRDHVGVPGLYRCMWETQRLD